VRPATGKKRPKNRAGWLGLYEKKRANLEALILYRQTIREGQRHHAALLLSCVLWKLTPKGQPADELRKRLFRFGHEQCDPPLADDAIEAAIDSGFKQHRAYEQTMSDWLDISPAEVAILPRKWPVATRYAPLKPVVENPPADGPTEAERRRELVAEHWTSDMTLKDLREWLERQGVEVSRSTLKRDLEKLGRVNPRSPAVIRRQKYTAEAQAAQPGQIHLFG